MKDKGLVKRRSSEGSFIPVMPDTPPPTPIRNDYLPPPPVQPSDENFIRPAIDTTRALGDNFSRPKTIFETTKIVDPKKKKKKIEITLQKEKTHITKQIYQNNSLSFFLSFMKL